MLFKNDRVIVFASFVNEFIVLKCHINLLHAVVSECFCPKRRKVIAFQRRPVFLEHAIDTSCKTQQMTFTNSVI